MQVNIASQNSALVRQRRRLQETAQADRARADELESQSAQDRASAEEKLASAGSNRQKGAEYKSESDRLRKSGRDQSRRGLERLVQGSDAYSESFAKQEQGLADLQSGLDTVTAANQTKSDALDKINGGLAEQVVHNGKQTLGLNEFAGHQAKSGELAEHKQAGIERLQSNNQAQSDNLAFQTERVGDYLLAGADFQEGGSVKEGGTQKLGQAVEHRAQGEAHNDDKTFHELHQSWGEEDAGRHQRAEQQLAFSAMYESLKAQASQINAAFHRRAAERNEQSAQELSATAQQMRSEAQAMMHCARQLEWAGQHHIAIGQQMKCCPWTYCQGLQLEQQGCAEIAQAQQMKARAQEMRAQAQEKSMQAEEARVKAEQAREVSEEFEVKGHGQELRSGILSDRADSHQTEAEKAEQFAQEQGVKAEAAGEAAKSERDRASELEAQGLVEWGQGQLVQHQALGAQREALKAHGESVESEKALLADATAESNQLSEHLSGGRRFLGLSGSLLYGLNRSVSEERESQAKVQDGINEFEGGLSESKAGADKAQEAAKMLEEARELELEGLRLQNRGQKMLLEARPKMADAARLSAQSFDAFKTADSEEREAQRLMEAGEQKLQAAAILRNKAQAYENLAASK